jgi:hypothetical protein
MQAAPSRTDEADADRGALVQCSWLRFLSLIPLMATLVVVAPRTSAAQDEPPAPIGPFVLDVHGIAPSFPDEPQLAQSRGMLVGELPGRALGLHVGAHFYPYKWKAVTFGIGADVTALRAHQDAVFSGDVQIGRPVTEELSYASGQLSFNFGKGDGWSYISGGYGPGQWSLVPDGDPPTDIDTLIQPMANYGAGARWFIKRHFAFSFDVRIIVVVPKASLPGYPPPPRLSLFSIGAGISYKPFAPKRQ